jgi:antitoxin CcdA
MRMSRTTRVGSRAGDAGPRAEPAAARTARRKVPTNLSLRADLARRAKALGINLSELLEAALTHAIAEAERAAWLAENREAIDAYNARVGERGVFGDGWRRF